MINYQDSSVSGEKYRRASRVIIENPLGGSPSLTFVEEDVVSVEGQNISQPGGQLQVPYDPTVIIALMDPVTGQPLGNTVTMQDVFGIIYSAYFQFGKQRDSSQ